MDRRVHRHLHSELSTAQTEGGNAVTAMLLTLECAKALPRDLVGNAGRGSGAGPELLHF